MADAAHDVRETAARFRLPRARQQWVETADGKTINSADTQKRGMPPYLLILDLGYAAFFSAASSLIDSVADVPTFFALYFSVAWTLWIVNQRMNIADAEDVSFELFVFAMALLVLVMAFDAPECFREYRTPACVEFAMLYGGARLLLLFFSAYLAYFLPGIRLMIAMEILGPLGYGSAIGIGLWRIGMGGGANCSCRTSRPAATCTASRLSYRSRPPTQ